jgi:uncharacterized protein YggE
MKSLSLVVLLFLATLSAGAREDTVPAVTVFGTAITQVKPDLLRWRLTVTNRAPDVATVSEQHTAYTAALLRLLSEKGIRPEEMQTTGMRFAEHREYRDRGAIKDGYDATTQVSFTMRKFTDYREMWLGLSRLAGVMVDSISWDTTTRIEVQNSTRDEALKNARAKADQMATGLGSRIAAPLAIEEVLMEDPWTNPSANFNSSRVAPPSDGSSDEAVAPGAVPIRVRVKVSFQLAAGSGK